MKTIKHCISETFAWSKISSKKKNEVLLDIFTRLTRYNEFVISALTLDEKGKLYWSSAICDPSEDQKPGYILHRLGLVPTVDGRKIIKKFFEAGYDQITLTSERVQVNFRTIVSPFPENSLKSSKEILKECGIYSFSSYFDEKSFDTQKINYENVNLDFPYKRSIR